MMKPHRITLRVAVCLAVTVCASSVLAAPMLWNKHPDGPRWYEYIHLDGDQNWYTCREYAIEQLGHDLATITSSQENAFVTALLNMQPEPVTAWLGGFQEPADSAPAENWHWITGEPWVYTNWWPGEPNDAEAGNEDGLSIWGGQGSDRAGYWNDAKRDGYNPRNYGFVIEYIPEPASLALLLTGSLGILSRRRQPRSFE